MFGISFSELAVIAVIALVVVGPQKLPGMLRTMGLWVRKIRKLTTEVRAQTGIDEILREEGIDGVHELRSLLRGEIAAAKSRRQSPADDPYLETLEFDALREYPIEGPDAYHAVPDDLLDETAAEKAEATADDSAAAPDEPAATDESAATEKTTEPEAPAAAEKTAAPQASAASGLEAPAPPAPPAPAEASAALNDVAALNSANAPRAFTPIPPEASLPTNGKPT